MKNKILIIVISFTFTGVLGTTLLNSEIREHGGDKTQIRYIDIGKHGGDKTQISGSYNIY